MDDVMLTYDRPEASNKVILRRRPSTGTWEVFSESQATADEYSERESLIINSISHSNHSDVHTSVPDTWSHEPTSTGRSISGSSTGKKHRHRSELTEAIIDLSTSSSQAVSPRTPPPSGTRRHSSRLAAAAHSSDSSLTSPTKRELRQRHEDPEYKPPGSGSKKECKSPRVVARKLTLPVVTLLSSSSAPFLTVPTNNHVHVKEEDEEDEGGIGSRTRQKFSSLVASSSFPSASSQLEKSPNHKYPTRHKLPNQN